MVLSANPRPLGGTSPWPVEDHRLEACPTGGGDNGQATLNFFTDNWPLDFFPYKMKGGQYGGPP